jgi:predicted NodU family carbamoyl transferase
LSSIVNVPRQLADGAPHHLRERFRGIRSDVPFRWHFVAHHLAHAASAFHASPFDRAAVLTLDGRGEKATTGFAAGRGIDLEWLGQVHMPHSLGLLYEDVTEYLGFLRSSDEYKVMALASFGKPQFVREFREIVRLGPEGQYTIGPRRLDDLPGQVAELLADDRVIGWFQGRMEFGPRALGARSILASPIHAEMQARLNDIKDREDFRPVAPVVLEEEAGAWFVGADVSPFMLFVFDVRPEKAGLIPAVRHSDGTARIQTVNRAQHPLYYDLIKAFQARTAVPVLVNTSFNTRGEPIVCTPRDAVESFWTSPLDALVIGSFLVEKPAGVPAP